jgi:hypothetical protein
MLFILRLTNGDCVIVTAADEPSARESALHLNPENPAAIASVRPLAHLCVQLTPTEDASLEVVAWDGPTLDSIFAQEYPLLEKAYRRANAQSFPQSTTAPASRLEALQEWYEKNLDLIREAVEQERTRLAPSSAADPIRRQTQLTQPEKSKAMKIGSNHR